MTMTELSATEVIQKIRRGEITSVELVQACLDRIDETDGQIKAWAHLDAEHALAQAEELDSIRRSGRPVGLLHGVPVGVKDIIDTAYMPTEYGTVLHKGRTPSKDATVVARLREAGAVILGKTVTTELAVFSPGKTRNPHNPNHTPGGSSSGSAAAVAAGMVPLAVGTQTNGSTIRPAAYCGVFGFKPSMGKISRHGVLTQSPPLETVGVFGRTLEDIALLGETLMAYDARDAAMSPQAKPQISRIMQDDPPVDPRIAFVRTPVWDQAEDSTKEACRELNDHIGAHVDILDLPKLFDKAHDCHRTIMEADLARNFAKEYRDGKKHLSENLIEMIERGQNVRATAYNDAIETASDLNDCLNAIFDEYDAILTPSVAGEAPKGLESTGSPAFCTIWTLCGTPALNLPLMEGPAGLPLGIQLVSHRGDEARLFRTARWLLTSLEV